MHAAGICLSSWKLLCLDMEALDHGQLLGTLWAAAWGSELGTVLPPEYKPGFMKASRQLGAFKEEEASLSLFPAAQPSFTFLLLMS